MFCEPDAARRSDHVAVGIGLSKTRTKPITGFSSRKYLGLISKSSSGELLGLKAPQG